MTLLSILRVNSDLIKRSPIGRFSKLTFKHLICRRIFLIGQSLLISFVLEESIRGRSLNGTERASLKNRVYRLDLEQGHSGLSAKVFRLACVGALWAPKPKPVSSLFKPVLVATSS